MASAGSLIYKFEICYQNLQVSRQSSRYFPTGDEKEFINYFPHFSIE